MRFRSLAIESLESRSVFAYGDVDGNFGNAGKLTFSIADPFNSQDYALTATASKDGGTWIAGESESKAAIVKLTTNGTLDASFDSDGRALYTFKLASGNRIESIRERYDGSLIVSGVLGLAVSGTPFVAKIQRNGALDESFADDGVWLGIPGSRLSLISSNDDDILLLEQDFNVERTTAFRIQKLTSAGLLDSNFANTGSTQRIVGNDGLSGSVIHRFVVADTNSITLAYTEPSPSLGPRFLKCYRYHRNGAVDTSFGVNGASSIVRQDALTETWLRLTDNEFLVGSIDVNSPDDNKPKITKVNILTGLVSGFGSQGELKLSIPTNRFYEGQSLLQFESMSNGSTRASWTMTDNQSNRILLTSVFSATGVLDFSYGASGLSTAPLNSRLYPAAPLIQTQLATLIFGSAGFPRDFGVVALGSSGQLKPSFGVDGELKIDLSTPTTYVSGFALSGIGSSEFSVLSQPGNTDSHNGGVETQNLLGGKTRSHRLEGYYSNSVMESYVSDSGWTVLAKHSFLNGVYKIVVNRIDLNGVRDPFGELQFTSPHFVDSFKFRETRDGNLLLIADTFGSTIGTAILIKLTRDGKLLTSYADQGVKRLVDLPDRLFDVVEVDQGMRLIVSNPSDNFTNIQIMALDSSGSQVLSYGTNGVLKIFGSRRQGVVFDVVQDGTGILLLMNLETKFNLIRFDDQGLDLKFGSSGYKVLTTSRPLSNFPIQTAQVRKSYESIVVVSTIGGPDSAIELSVLDKIGEPLFGFGSNGVVVLNPSSFNESLADVVPMRDGSILVGMSSQSEFGQHGVVIRLLGPTPNPRPFFNIRQPLNVSAAEGDTSVNPLDVLIVVNYLNVSSGIPAGFADTDGDGSITPLDVLLIINFLNRTSGNGEGELVAQDDTLENCLGEESFEELSKWKHLHGARRFQEPFRRR